MIAGQPIVTKRFLTPGSSAGTSIATTVGTEIFGPMRVPVNLPTINGGILNGRCCKIVWTKSATKFVSRWIPWIGWAKLAYDAAGAAGCMCGCGDN